MDSAQAMGGSASVSVIGGPPPPELLQTVGHPFGSPGKTVQDKYRMLEARQRDIAHFIKQEASAPPATPPDTKQVLNPKTGAAAWAAAPQKHTPNARTDVKQEPSLGASAPAFNKTPAPDAPRPILPKVPPPLFPGFNPSPKPSPKLSPKSPDIDLDLPTLFPATRTHAAAKPARPTFSTPTISAARTPFDPRQAAVPLPRKPTKPAGSRPNGVPSLNPRSPAVVGAAYQMRPALQPPAPQQGGGQEGSQQRAPPITGTPAREEQRCWAPRHASFQPAPPAPAPAAAAVRPPAPPQPPIVPAPQQQRQQPQQPLGGYTLSDLAPRVRHLLKTKIQNTGNRMSAEAFQGAAVAELREMTESYQRACIESVSVAFSARFDGGARLVGVKAFVLRTILAWKAAICR